MLEQYGTEHTFITYLADAGGTSAVIGTNADDQQSLEVQPVSHALNASAEAQQVAESQKITGQQSATDTAGAAGLTTGATFAAPCAGTVVSTFGGQYGSFHYGIEIKNVRNTPIVASATGVIIAAGPTSGFGLWVKEQLSDGTTLVYARMDTYAVQVGQHVTAGQPIAAMGNRGFSTGYTWALAGDEARIGFLEAAGWAPDGSRASLDMGVKVPVVRLHTRQSSDQSIGTCASVTAADVSGKS